MIIIRNTSKKIIRKKGVLSGEEEQWGRVLPWKGPGWPTGSELIRLGTNARGVLQWWTKIQQGKLLKSFNDRLLFNTMQLCNHHES